MSTTFLPISIKSLAQDRKEENADNFYAFLIVSTPKRNKKYEFFYSFTPKPIEWKKKFVGKKEFEKYLCDKVLS